MSDQNQTDNEKSIHAGHRDRLRKRYLRSGLDDFADHEVLELLLTYTILRKDVNKQAHHLIERFGSVSAVLDAPPKEISEVDGIGPGTAQFLTMLPAVFRRYASDRVRSDLPMDTVAKIGEFFHAKYVGVNVERIYLLLLDNRMCKIGCYHLGDGSVNCSNVTVRKIAELALLNKASAAVLAHNHPKGLTIPSSADIEVTQLVDSALETIGVPLLEHMVVTENNYAPIMRHHKGLLRASPMTGNIDTKFYRKFYGET